MATIRDYLRWRGDLSFAERPFNVVDNLVLATLSYVDLRELQGMAGPLPLSAILDALLATGDDVTPLIRSMAAIDAELLRLAACSTRFGTMMVRDYVDEIDTAAALQFSAMTCDLDDDLTAVVYRGTDHSLVGWRENFMLSFKVTLAQQRAAAYLRRAARRAVEKGRRLVVCGHSKGGNLAAYAAAVCPPLLQQRIEQVWSDDGPGMATEVVPEDLVANLGPKFVHVVPEFSVVGMIFLPDDERRVVVRSTASGFLQHDPTTWMVEPSDICRAPALSAESQLVAETFSAWLSDVDLASREAFTHELFDAMAAGDPDRIDGVFTSPAAIQRVLVASADLSPRTRAVIRKLVGTITTTATGVAASAVDRAVVSASAAVRSLAGSRQPSEVLARR